MKLVSFKDGGCRRKPANPNAPQITAAANCGFHSSISCACSRNSTSLWTIRGQGRFRHRQNRGAVGHVTRAIVVVAPWCVMVMDLRSAGERGALQEVHSELPARSVHLVSATAASACLTVSVT